ncbi:hypothetical protein IWW50_004969 [Coemansia erecta]|nr:hypothetical protein IWW50_004969 [Coemansia erecta]
MDATATEVTTRGRYHANVEDATPADPVLHLHVEAATQESLDQAVAMIERLKAETPSEQSGSIDDMSNSFAGTHFGGDRHRSSRMNSGSSYNLQDKIFVEIESERGFNVRAKLIGTGGENMKYIQSATGARVQVRGRGSGFFEGHGGAEDQEPMHLLVMAGSDDVLNQARNYCRSLVDTMHAQYNEFKEHGGRRGDRHSHRDNRDRYGHNGRQQQYQQQYAHPYPQQDHTALQYQQTTPYSGAPSEGDQSAAQAAAYEEYANYCAQYYQYYGTYPDYSAYYSQADPNTAQYQQAEQPSQSVGMPVDHPNGVNAAPETSEQDGYHNVPPPPNYSNGHKKV